MFQENAHWRRWETIVIIPWFLCNFHFIFMQFLCLQNLPFNVSKTGAFTKIERITSCKVAGRLKILHENSLNYPFKVPYDHFGCFPNNEGVYNIAETEYHQLMHVGYCVHYCFSKNYPLASLGGNADRYVDKFGRYFYLVFPCMCIQFRIYRYLLQSNIQ